MMRSIHMPAEKEGATEHLCAARVEAREQARLVHQNALVSPAKLGVLLSKVGVAALSACVLRKVLRRSRVGAGGRQRGVSCRKRAQLTIGKVHTVHHDRAQRCTKSGKEAMIIEP